MKRLFFILFASVAFSIFSAEAAVEEKSAILKPGSDLFMGVNYVRYNTILKADFTFSDFSSVMVGRGGEGIYRAHWLEVTPVYIIIRECSYVAYKDDSGKKKSRMPKMHSETFYRYEFSP